MNPLILMSGPCAVEDGVMPFDVARKIKKITDRLGIEFIFKSSWKKANRSRLDSFTGIDRMDALNILKAVKDEVGCPVITDIHESHEAEMVAKYVDYLQIPAFLCRQTDLLLAAGETGLPVNIKKGQFLAPEQMKFAADKVRSVGKGQEVFLTERGTTFGYQNLVVDITSLPRMLPFGKVILDATHCLQMPNQTKGVTGGNPDMIETMARAAVAVGVDGLFIETHPNPQDAKSDSATQLQLDQLEGILERVLKIREAAGV